MTPEPLVWNDPEMAKQVMEVLEEGGAGRVAFWGAEHPPFCLTFSALPPQPSL